MMPIFESRCGILNLSLHELPLNFDGHSAREGSTSKHIATRILFISRKLPFPGANSVGKTITLQQYSPENTKIIPREWERQAIPPLPYSKHRPPAVGPGVTMHQQYALSTRAISKLGASLLFATSLILSGCSGGLTSTPVSAKAIAVSGNWQITATDQAAATLPALSGTLTGSSTSMNGILHSDSASACIPPTQAIEVSGSADANNLVTLTGNNVAGGKLTINGTLAADGKSITNATYKVTGGSCGFNVAAHANAQQYADISGTYNGSFYDSDSATVPVLQMTAQLTQSPTGDTTGNFTMTGQANLGTNPCFASPTALTSAQVTGGSFAMTYADANTGNSVNMSGTFSPDGTSLTVTNWSLTGPCGPDSGNGTMVKQPAQ